MECYYRVRDVINYTVSRRNLDLLVQGWKQGFILFTLQSLHFTPETSMQWYLGDFESLYDTIALH